jgi:hypothetical protein
MASACRRANESLEKVIESSFRPALVPALMLHAALPADQELNVRVKRISK